MQEWKLALKLKCYIATNYIPVKFLKDVFGWSRPYPKVFQFENVEYKLKDENLVTEHYSRE